MEINELRNRPNRLPWPPMILVATLGIGYLLKYFAPLEIGLDDLRPWVSGLLIVCAITIDVLAMLTLSRARTTILPNQRSENLVTNGVFSVSRNPIYVANILLLLGIAMWTNNLWLLLLTPLSAFATQQLAIVREEAHLISQFGTEYSEYQSRVRRWL
ncbi:MAG: isoprenylcysteine carboxylmethyltransferase family protein [Pseudomonadota bacterium]